VQPDSCPCPGQRQEQILTTLPLVRIFDRCKRDHRTRCDYRDLPLLNDHNPRFSQGCSAAYTSTPGYDGALDRTTIDHSLCLLSLDREPRDVKSPFLFLTPTNQPSRVVATTRLSTHRISTRSLRPVNSGRRCTSPKRSSMRSEVRTSTVPRSTAAKFGRPSGKSVVQTSLLLTQSGERNSRGVSLSRVL
jgi:hypothetical protein